MLGPNLLVAPVFAKDGVVDFYVPESEDDGDQEVEWMSLFDGKAYKPGKWYQETHGFMTLPILVRPNRLIVRNMKISLAEEDIEKGLEVMYGRITKEVEVDVVDADGKRLGTIIAMPEKDGEVIVRGDGVEAGTRQAGRFLWDLGARDT